METNTATQLTQSTAEGKRQPRRKPAKGFKLTRFDEDAFKLLRRGAASVAAITIEMGVDAGEVRRRLLQLEKRKLVTFNAGNSDSVGLTVKGYNEYSPKTLETSSEKKRKTAGTNAFGEAAAQQAISAQEPTKEPVKETAEAPVEETAKEPFEETLTQATELNTPAGTDIPAGNNIPTDSPQEKVDLAELLARGAPRSRSVFIERQGRAENKERQATRQEKVEGAPAKPSHLEGESCDLCKEPFKLSVGGGNPKFGHCFCGAAYHKDCHEAILDGDGRCVRCGRALGKVLDRKSVEAMRQLKGVFE